jgi:iron complex outermembrane receptor protein
MRSQFDQNPDFADATVNNVWPTFRAIILGGITDPAQRAQLNALIPTQLSETINGILRSLATGGVLAADQIQDVDPVRPSITNTIEAGYKGVLGNKLLLSVDIYSTRIKDRVAGLQAVTPGVFLDAPNLLRVLGKDIAARLIAAGLPPAQAQAQATAIVQQLTPTIAQFAALPVGVINPEQQGNSLTKDTDVIATYRNFGEVSINGMDLSLFYNATANWVLGMNYSFVTKNGFNIFKRPNRVFFRNVDNTGNNIPLNAPGNKIALSVQYRAPERGYDVELRGRYIEGFPHETGVFIGEVQTYSVFDLNLGYDLPFSKGTRWSINAINILDKKHREFIGAPILGRLILTRITQSL